MPTLFFDTETELISPGRNAPPMVCLSGAVDDGPAFLLHWTQAGDYLKRAFDAGWKFVGANVGFDMAVVCAQFPELTPRVFQAYLEDRVTDVQDRQKLIDIASGVFRGYLNKHGKWTVLNYSLADLTKRHTGKQLDKGGDSWRLRYGELRHLPVNVWPQEASKYALEDADSTRAVWYSQEAIRLKMPHVDVLANECHQARGFWFLRLTSAWGLRTNPAAVDELERKTMAEYDRLEALLVEAGLVKSDGVRDTKAAKRRMLEVMGWAQDVKVEGEGRKKTKSYSYTQLREDARKLHLSDSEDISLSAEACEACGDPVLALYGELGTLKSVVSKDIKALRGGVLYPIHTRFDMAASGRSTSASPNVQNWRRLPGIREAFEPRPGYVYAQADVEGLELATLAQTCLEVVGWSKLADAINAGLDAHTDLACALLGIPYEEGVRRRKIRKDTLPAGHPDIRLAEEFDDARQTAKVANFGFPGGLGIETMVIFAKALYNVTISLEKCRWLKERWLAKWPEMASYFGWISSQMTNPDRTGSVTQLFSDRIRGGVTYTAACNTFFQGLGADATKHAGWRIAWACYNDPSSPLYGSRIVNYIHDEFIVETLDNSNAHEVAVELERIMVAAIKEWVPDIRIAAPPLLMRYWSKNAKAVTDSNGRLIPWSEAPHS